MGIPKDETIRRAAMIPAKVERAVAFTVSPASPRAKPELKAIGKTNSPIGKLGNGPKL
jgi:hypothetical protein